MIQSKSWRALVYGKKRKKIRTSRGNDRRETSDHSGTAAGIRYPKYSGYPGRVERSSRWNHQRNDGS